MNVLLPNELLPNFQTNNLEIPVGVINLKDGTRIPLVTFDNRIKLNPDYKQQGLCPSEPFRDQPVSTRAIASGFLVAPDIVATAAHVIHDAALLEKGIQKLLNLETIRFVFGFQMQDENRLLPSENFESYEAEQKQEIPFYRLDTSNGKYVDWALIKLKKPVSRHFTIISIRHDGKVPDNQPLHVIGHPTGLPLKYANNIKVQKNNPTLNPEGDKTFFLCNSDTYSGNSGSPVFNSQTHVVEGIHVAGKRPEFALIKLGNNKECVVSNWFPDVSDGESCTRTTEFSSALMKKVWSGFKPIPGLIGTENQGGDVAVTECIPVLQDSL